MKLNELIILEAGKDPMLEKPHGDELEALAHFCGICNLGYGRDNVVKDGKFTLNQHDYIATDFKGIKSAIIQQLSGMAENDEMMDDFETEIGAWRKDLSNLTREQIVKGQKNLAPIFAIIVNTGVV